MLPERSALLSIISQVSFLFQVSLCCKTERPFDRKKKSKEEHHSFHSVGSCPNCMCAQEIAVSVQRQRLLLVWESRRGAACGPAGTARSQGAGVNAFRLAWGQAQAVCIIIETTAYQSTESRKSRVAGMPLWMPDPKEFSKRLPFEYDCILIS